MGSLRFEYFHTMLRLLFLTILTSLCLFGSGQNIKVRVHYINKSNSPSSDTIYYTPPQKLVWDDFRGKPVPNHFGGAVTASGFSFTADTKYDGDDITINFYVSAFFTKHDSWRKPGINSPYHLEHEQKHFDITYINARKFVAELRKARFTKRNIKTLPGEIFNKAYDDNTAMQQQYDRETNHSINNTAQEQWNKKIDAMLKDTGKQSD